MVVRKYRFAAIFSVLIQTYNKAFVYYYIDIGLQKSTDYQNPESRSRRGTAAMFYSSLVNISGKTQKHLFYLSLKPGPFSEFLLIFSDFFIRSSAQLS